MNTIPTITKNLLIINVLCFFASIVFATHNIDLNDIFGLHFFMADNFRPWQLFTYMFMHASWDWENGGALFSHLFFNMFAVWMFGRIMEQTMGPRRFLIYYIVCGLGAGLMQELVQLAEYWYLGLHNAQKVLTDTGIKPIAEALNYWNTVGASGAVYGILLAYGMTFPNERMFVFPIPVPVKVKYFVVGFAVIELLSALSQKGDGVAHMAHLGGMLVGLLLLLYWRNGGGNGYNRGGYGNYGSHNNTWNNFRNRFTSMFKKKEPHIDIRYGGRYNQEAAYRQQKKQDEEELNRILDKVKKNGYDGLTPEEKKRLFDITRK